MGELDRIARAFCCHEPSMTSPLLASRCTNFKLTHHRMIDPKLPKQIASINIVRPPIFHQEFEFLVRKEQNLSVIAKNGDQAASANYTGHFQL